MIEFAEILETIAHAPIQKRAMTNHGVLNEAYAYAKPSSFSRGMRIDLERTDHPAHLGHRSIDENGKSVHIGDFRAQMQRTSTTSPVCWKAKAAPGTTSCAPVLPARHRSRLRSVQRRAHRIFQSAGA